jgi:hypothetical protein
MNSLIIKVNGTSFVYECHSYQTAAEIIAGTVAIEGAQIESWELV